MTLLVLPLATTRARGCGRTPWKSSRGQLLLRLAAPVLALGLSACAQLTGPTPTPTPAPGVSQAGDACARWFAQLDRVIDSAGVRDAEAERIVGFAGLRVDRAGAALRERAAASAAAFDAWLSHLQGLEAAGRAAELANLPGTAFPLDDAADASAANARSRACSDAWRLPLQADPALRASLPARAVVPDRYASVQRAVGLYPLLRWPFFAGVESWQREHEGQMARWSVAPPPTQRYVPAASPPSPKSPTSPPSPPSLADLWQRPRDALGLPQFQADEAAALLAAHAPALAIETRGDFDRFGALHWRAGLATPAVDSAAPVVYQRLASTRYRSQWLVQLVYTLWFPERPPRHRFDVLAGALDAVVLRITLAPDDGRPLLLDAIHACGCYHLFLPTAEMRPRDNAPQGIEWAFAPTTLPVLRPGQRLVVSLNSASHYVMAVAAEAAQAGTSVLPSTAYTLRDDSELRRLPLPQGGTRSVYGPDGLVAGTERAERFLFWPMGIASAGAMRQWGHHASAFVGRRHFDDADLIERRFVIPSLE